MTALAGCPAMRSLRSVERFSAKLQSLRSISLRAVRADGQARTPVIDPKAVPSTAAQPGGSRVAHCQGAAGMGNVKRPLDRRGGAAGIRTPDLRRARAALSRLSYGPPRGPATHQRWARLDSNQGPRPYQGRALTT